jgi:hypothetical protein
MYAGSSVLFFEQKAEVDGNALFALSFGKTSIRMMVAKPLTAGIMVQGLICLVDYASSQCSAQPTHVRCYFFLRTTDCFFLTRTHAVLFAV